MKCRDGQSERSDFDWRWKKNLISDGSLCKSVLVLWTFYSYDYMNDTFTTSLPHAVKYVVSVMWCLYLVCIFLRIHSCKSTQQFLHWHKNERLSTSPECVPSYTWNHSSYDWHPVLCVELGLSTTTTTRPHLRHVVRRKKVKIVSS